MIYNISNNEARLNYNYRNNIMYNVQIENFIKNV